MLRVHVLWCVGRCCWRVQEERGELLLRPEALTPHAFDPACIDCWGDNSPNLMGPAAAAVESESGQSGGLALGVWRSALGAWRSALGAWRSARLGA